MLSVFSDKLDSVIWKALSCHPLELSEQSWKITLPQLLSKLELLHSQFSSWSSQSRDPQCSEFFCSSKGRMLWQQELLDTRRWPFPTHNPSHLNSRGTTESWSPTVQPWILRGWATPPSKPTVICCTREETTFHPHKWQLFKPLSLWHFCETTENCYPFSQKKKKTCPRVRIEKIWELNSMTGTFKRLVHLKDWYIKAEIGTFKNLCERKKQRFSHLQLFCKIINIVVHSLATHSSPTGNFPHKTQVKHCNP